MSASCLDDGFNLKTSFCIQVAMITHGLSIVSKNKFSPETLLPKPITLVSSTILLLILNLSGSVPPVHGFTPDDPEGDPWHLDAINIHSVWEHGYSFHSPNVVGLCVIGEPIVDNQNGDLNMTDRASFAWNSDYSSYLPYPSVASNNHEAAVASVAISTINNGIGVAGIVNAPLYSAWLWGNYPFDDMALYHMYVQQMTDIFEWGAGHGKIVFTMSFIATVYDLEFTDPVYVALRNTVSDLYESGQALFFAASGNNLYPLHPKDVPQALPYVRVVGRIDRYNNYQDGGTGDELFLVAPAGGVPAYMQTSQNYGAFGGASCSTPIVAASAVLLWNQFPWASNVQIEDALSWGATDILDPGWDDRSGFGALNVEKAREYLTENVPSSNSYRPNISDTPTINDTSSSFIVQSVPIFVGVLISISISSSVIVILIKRRRN
ncbi:MAG: S8/S53 family peptidase [Candidatus Thorarchaeota archaeon]